MSIKEAFNISKSVWSMSMKMARKYPVILLPFFITAICNALTLAVLYYFPRKPWSLFFASPIRNFKGEKFLHYPSNFLVLPELFYYFQIFIMATIGVIMFGMAVNLIYQANSGDVTPKPAGSFNKSARRYLTLAGIWATLFVLSFIILKVPGIILVRWLGGKPITLILIRTFFYLGFICIIIIEAFLVYAYPSAIIGKKKYFASLKSSFNLSRQVFIASLILVAAPRLLEVGYILARGYMIPFFVKNVPELSVGVIVFGIVLVMFTDFFVISAITNLYILAKETDNNENKL
ncbi:MAG: hypothetical protein PHO00_05395 [bacterium]|nr:hypothetical protein [bacterium]